MSLSPKILSAAVLMALCETVSAATPTTTAESRAANLIKTNMAATRTSASDTFVATRTTVDANGAEHVRFKRSYQGLPVIGGDLVVHSKAGVFNSASQTLSSPVTVSTTPKITASEAITIAGAAFGSKFDGLPTSSLVVFARRGTPKLAYEVLYSGTRTDGTPTRMHYFVDANTSAILAKWDAIETGVLPVPTTTTPAVGSGKSFMSGTVPLNTVYTSRRLYELNDSTRGGIFTVDYGNTFRDETATKVVDGDNKWGTGTTTDRATFAVDAQWGVATTWDYYKNTFNRLGVANNGVGSRNNVHFIQNYVNAFWQTETNSMTFGDGNLAQGINPVVQIDVTGHEMTHGVTAYSADLIYDGASGGLNEATSDIFGTMVEYYANNSLNPPNYMIAERLFVSNPSHLTALRYMFKPTLDDPAIPEYDYPGGRYSQDCYPNVDPDPNGYEYFFNVWLDPHYSSGPANHFFYLLAEGAVVPAVYNTAPVVPDYVLTPAQLVCNGNTAIVGIGRPAASAIWYRALTVYMTSDTNYQGARAATLSAAADLYGNGSTQYNAVNAAWAAVNLYN